MIAVGETNNDYQTQINSAAETALNVTKKTGDAFFLIGAAVAVSAIALPAAAAFAVGGGIITIGGVVLTAEAGFGTAALSYGMYVSGIASAAALAGIAKRTAFLSLGGTEKPLDPALMRNDAVNGAVMGSLSFFAPGTVQASQYLSRELSGVPKVIAQIVPVSILQGAHGAAGSVAQGGDVEQVVMATALGAATPYFFRGMEAAIAAPKNIANHVQTRNARLIANGLGVKSGSPLHQAAVRYFSQPEVKIQPITRQLARAMRGEEGDLVCQIAARLGYKPGQATYAKVAVPLTRWALLGPETLKTTLADLEAGRLKPFFGSDGNLIGFAENGVYARVLPAQTSAANIPVKAPAFVPGKVAAAARGRTVTREPILSALQRGAELLGNPPQSPLRLRGEESFSLLNTLDHGLKAVIPKWWRPVPGTLMVFPPGNGGKDGKSGRAGAISGKKNPFATERASARVLTMEGDDPIILGRAQIAPLDTSIADEHIVVYTSDGRWFLRNIGPADVFLKKPDGEKELLRKPSSPEKAAISEQAEPGTLAIVEPNTLVQLGDSHIELVLPEEEAPRVRTPRSVPGIRAAHPVPLDDFKEIIVGSRQPTPVPPSGESVSARAVEASPSPPAQPKPRLTKAIPFRADPPAGSDFYTLTIRPDADVTVGRNDSNQVPIPVNEVSGKHCTFHVDKLGNITVEDHGSTNGTSLDGGQTTFSGETRSVKDGSVVFLGPASIKVQVERQYIVDNKAPGNARFRYSDPATENSYQEALSPEVPFERERDVISVQKEILAEHAGKSPAQLRELARVLMEEAEGKAHEAQTPGRFKENIFDSFRARAKAEALLEKADELDELETRTTVRDPPVPLTTPARAVAPSPALPQALVPPSSPANRLPLPPPVSPERRRWDVQFFGRKNPKEARAAQPPMAAGVTMMPSSARLYDWGKVNEAGLDGRSWWPRSADLGVLRYYPDVYRHGRVLEFPPKGVETVVLGRALGAGEARGIQNPKERVVEIEYPNDNRISVRHLEVRKLGKLDNFRRRWEWTKQAEDLRKADANVFVPPFESMAYELTVPEKTGGREIAVMINGVEYRSGEIIAVKAGTKVWLSEAVIVMIGKPE